MGNRLSLTVLSAWLVVVVGAVAYILLVDRVGVIEPNRPNSTTTTTMDRPTTTTTVAATLDLTAPSGRELPVETAEATPKAETTQAPTTTQTSATPSTRIPDASPSRVSDDGAQIGPEGDASPQPRPEKRGKHEGVGSHDDRQDDEGGKPGAPHKDDARKD